ncbi:MAG: amino acid permease [Nitrososphaeraceae archaeon]|nr:amino acid permease [Nitrososphaeraceae archaeon]
MTLLDVVMVGIAAMIGGSIFVLTGPAIGLAGSAVIIAFIINATITLFTAMAYAELGSAMPEAGGGYLWVREGLPRPNAFISGWMAWFAHIVAGSLYAVSFASFLNGLLMQLNLFKDVGSEGTLLILGIIPLDKVIAVASIAAFTYVNFKGTSETGKTGTIVTVIQLGLIFALIGAGLWTMHANQGWTLNFSNFMPMGIAGIVAAMGLTFIAFEGYEVIVQTGEEVKNPKRNIPRAIFISLSAVVVLYCLIAFVSIGAIFPEGGVPSWKFIGDQGELGISAAAELIIPYGAFIVLGGGMISTLAALNATTFSSARVAFAMGRHYNLPHRFSAIHPKNKTPYIAILLSGLIMAVMASGLPLDQIAIAAGVIFLLLFTQVNLAAINIRRIYGDKLDYGFKTPFFPVIPIVGIFLKIGLAIYLLVTDPLSWVITIVWVAIGFAVYRVYIFRKELEHYAPTVTSEGAMERKDFRILILYTPENPDRLIKFAIRVAKENNGEVDVLRVITVPEQTPLSAGIAFADSAKRAYKPLEEALDKEGITNHYLARISHDATEAILVTIEEQHIDLLLADFETLRTNKKLQTLATCDALAVKRADDDLQLEATSRMARSSDYIQARNPNYAQQPQANTQLRNENNKKKRLVVLFDRGEHSDIVLRATRWIEHSGLFTVNILSINKGHDENTEEKKGPNHRNHSHQPQRLGMDEVEYNEIYLSKGTESSIESLTMLIQSTINAAQPDLLIVGASIARYSFLNDPHLLHLLEYLECPIIVAKSYSIPVIGRVKLLFNRVTRR